MFIRKILVAGLAVVGMVGMASAQSNASPIGSNKLTAPPTDQMTVTYSVSLQADMSVTSTGLSGAGLLVDGCAVANYANLGRVTVVTNYPYWDVSIEAQNKLQLTTGGTPPTPPVYGTNEFDEVVELQPGKLGTSGTPLKYDATNAAELDVCLGLREAGGWLTGSLINAESELSQGSASIAYVVGTELGASDEYNGQKGTEAGLGIVEKGFKTPADPNNGVIIYVSTGFKAGKGQEGIKGDNAEGDYTETLTFTLVAGF